ncbi:MAG TPA: hypothetical protein VJR58_26865, partial [Vineibacter sp.]|nr:hypothetical protein [Vineibacter sp.]
MAASLAKRVAWVALAAVAAGFVAVLAMRGERPEAGLQRFEPSGFLAQREPQDVRALVVEAAGRQWRYRRSPHGDWTAGEPSVAVMPDLVARIEQALELLRNARPERRFTADE